MAFVTPSWGALPGSGAVSTNSSAQTCPRMGPWKPGEKDAAFKQQQEILARRRNKQRNKEYFNSVRERRNKNEAELAEKRLVVRNGEDPLIPWKRLKEKGLIADAGYSEEDEGGIPLPMASFGIPKYDNGGRFDLKLPHVEIGYTDEDADVMKKAGNALKRFFGQAPKETKDTKVAEMKTDKVDDAKPE